MAASTSLQVRQVQDVTVVTFMDIAILDPRKVDTIAKELDALFHNSKTRRFVFDFALVKQLSSSALGHLALLRKKLNGPHDRLIVCGLSAELRKLFKITALDKLFELQTDEAAALASCGIKTA